MGVCSDWVGAAYWVFEYKWMIYKTRSGDRYVSRSFLRVGVIFADERDKVNDLPIVSILILSVFKKIRSTTFENSCFSASLSMKL